MRGFRGRAVYFHHGPGVLRLLVLLVLVALLVVSIVRLVESRSRRRDRRQRWMNGETWPHPRPGGMPPFGIDPAANELRVRYAKGEITREQFFERARDLGLPPDPAAASGPANPAS